MDPKTWRFGSDDFQFSNWVHFLDSMSLFSGVFSILCSCMMINLYCKRWYDHQSSYFGRGFLSNSLSLSSINIEKEGIWGCVFPNPSNI